MTTQTIAKSIAPAEFSTVVEAVKSAVTTGDAGLRLDGIGLDGATLHKSVADAVDSALSISILDALLAGWNGVKEISALTGDNGPMDDKPRVAALAQHRLKISHTPTIRVSLGRTVDIREIALPVTLDVTVAGVSLTIRNREIIKATTGQLLPRVVVKVEKVKIVEAKIAPIELSENLLADKAAKENEAA